MKKIQCAFVEAFGLPEETEFEKLEYRGIEVWDSVGHMRLIAELEGTFDIMLETEDILDMSSFNKAKEILAKYDVVFES